MDDKLQLVLYPDDRLRIKTIPVDVITPERVELANEMYKIMQENNGIGLAAPQVGLAISLVVLNVGGSMLAMFNPQILKRSKEVEYKSEGCISFPNIYRLIKRPIEVVVKFRDIHSKMQYIVLKGIDARCAVHEIEHLKGGLFIDLEEKT